MSLSRIQCAFAAQRRFFVSTVLLSRTWGDETVVELRKEAKARGLSTKGNKSTLIARIQEHEKNSTSPPTHALDSVRNVSSNAVPPQKISQAASPGIPLTAQSAKASTNADFLNIRLPDLSRTLPDAPVQIPYLPDFWNSARPKADVPLELEPPKLHVISGSATHYDGGPTHNLEKHQGDALSTAEDPSVTKEAGFWAEFWESVGLPRSFSARRTLSEARDLTSMAGEDEFRAHSRPLTDEERKGLYVLFGIIGGSLLVGGLANRRAAVPEGHDA